MPAAGLLISTDLLFTSKITGTARTLGLEVSVVPNLAAATPLLASQSFAALFLDLNALGPVDLAPLLQARPAGVRAIAFGSHVEVDRLDAARQAGCDEVLPRSRFSSALPQLLSHYLADPPAPNSPPP